MEAGVRALRGIANWFSVASLGVAMAFCVAGCGGSGTSVASNQTSAPAFSPGGGSYTSTQTVKITSTTAGAVLYCTTDGTTPTTSSPQCPSSMMVLKSQYVQAIAVAPNMVASSVSAAGYTIDLNAVPAPTLSPAGGTYNAPQQVTISAAAGANIYYTLDGSTPTTKSNQYTAPITVSTSQTLSAIAIASGYDNSAVASASYTIAPYPATTPILYPAGGTYPGAITVTLTDTTPNTTIYYTIDGSMPTTGSAVYNINEPISVSTTAAVQAIAVASGYTTSAVATAGYVIETPTSAPTFSIVAGTYTTTQPVTLLDAMPNATIYYTTNGDTPTVGGATTQSVASGSTVTVSQTETIKAIAVSTGYLSSALVAAAYTINPAAAAPTFDLATGQTYSTIQTVHILDSTQGATIHCTTDGTPATVQSSVCSGPITLSRSETINAVAIAPGYSVSADASAIYTVDLTETLPPTLSQGTGVYRPGTTINISAANGATIHYTLDGNPATVQSPVCALTNGVCQITLSTLGTTVLDAVAIASGHTVSSDALAVYTVSPAASTPTFSVGSVNLPSGGVYPYASSLSLTMGDTMQNCPKCTIYYTTDGSTPAINSSTTSIYNGTAIPVSSTDETIQAVVAAADGSYSASDVAAVELRIFAGSITGKVLSGTGTTATAISGATVEMLAAGTTGYSSTPTVAATYPTTATTDASGNFTLYYNCAPSPQDQMYLLASGGNAGGGTNPDIKLMSALGSSCTTTNGVTAAALPANVTVNEVTTIASAYALSAFSSMDNNGAIDVGAPATYNATVNFTATATHAAITSTASLCNADSNWQSTGPETCNYNGLKNAFLTTNNLVDPVLGAARLWTPAYSTNLAGDPKVLNNSTVPSTRINALADMLATCVRNSSNCSALFAGAATGAATATYVPAFPNVTPADTLQAALNIAQNASNNVSTLLSLVPTANQPYSTGTLALSGANAPTDLTLVLTFTGAGLGIAPGINTSDGYGTIANRTMDIDANGHIWVGGFVTQSAYSVQYRSMLAEFDNLGAPLTAATQLSSAARPVATYGGYAPPEPGFTKGSIDYLLVDPSGNLLAVDSYTSALLKIDTSSSLSTSVLASRLEQPDGIALDASGNLWAAEYGGQLGGFDSTGGVIYLSGTSGASSLSSLTFDSNGGIWGNGQSSTGNVNAFLEIDTTQKKVSFKFLSSGQDSPNVVADGLGNIYACDGYGFSGWTLDVFNNGKTVSGSGSALQTNDGCGGTFRLDGTGHLFAVANDWGLFWYEGLHEYTTSGGQISPAPGGYSGTSSAEAPTVNPQNFTDNSSGLMDGYSEAIDASGNVWLINDNPNGVGNPDINYNYNPQTGNVLVEYVGVAAPVVTPASAALANKLLGVRP